VALACACLLLTGCSAAGRSAATPVATGCTVPARFAGQEVDRLPISGKRMALTFDAGANADGVPSIRATLRRTKIRATFFLTGAFVQRYPAKAQRLARRDLVGNHTMTHPDLTTLTDRQVTTEVRHAEATIRTTTGQDPRRLFRFPYGARDDHLIDLVNGLCYVPFGWTVDTLGWEGTSGGQTEATVVAHVLAAAAPGAIVLMHVGSNPDDGTTLDADALPTIISRLRDRGYHFVRLDRVMSADP
jgi:peptidoglycan/xylan/chitin deacetylase (PgdA/CDA1 family)